VLPQNTIEDLTFLFFLKFAHFIDVNWEKKTSAKKSDDEEEMFPKPVSHYKDYYKNYFFNKKFHKGVLFKLMIDGKIYEHDSKVKMTTFTDESIRNWNDGLRLLKIEIILDSHLNTLNAAKLSYMKKIAADNFDVSLTELLKTEEEKLSKLDIYNLLARFSKKEQLDDDNMWKCTKCDKKVNALRSIQIYRAPKILILHMKKLKEGYERFRSGSDHLLVDFPVQGLDITNLVRCVEPIEAYNIPIDQFADENNPSLKKKIIPEFKWNNTNLVYDCFGVVNHYGSHYFGHYTAYVQNNGNWYTYDDSSVHRIDDPKSIVTEAAYVLFYRRRD
jgi:ubiquitin C-terminal hydrolase